MIEEYGLIGRGLSHSHSPRIWEELFDSQHDAASVQRSYSLFPLSAITILPALIDSRPHLRGFNVTVPYKEAVLPYLTDLTEEARRIGAVNTVLIDRCSSRLRLTGHNTDAAGFLAALRHTVGCREMPRKALVLGTGGAAKAVVYALTGIGTDVVTVSRNPAGDRQMRYEELSQSVMAERKLIVNATPLGMYPHPETCPPIPYQYVGKEHILFDLVYNPDHTRFMAQGEARGALVSNGMMMLREQARHALRFFTSSVP